MTYGSVAQPETTPEMIVTEPVSPTGQATEEQFPTQQITTPTSELPELPTTIPSGNTIQLLSPINDSETGGETPVFSWTEIPGAKRYVLIVMRNGKEQRRIKIRAEEPTCVQGICSLDTSTLTNFKPFKTGKKFHWFVKAATVDGVIKSATFRFRAVTPATSRGVDCDLLTPCAETPTSTYTPSVTPTSTTTPTMTATFDNRMCSIYYFTKYTFSEQTVPLPVTGYKGWLNGSIVGNYRQSDPTDYTLILTLNQNVYIQSAEVSWGDSVFSDVAVAHVNISAGSYSQTFLYSTQDLDEISYAAAGESNVPYHISSYADRIVFTGIPHAGKSGEHIQIRYVRLTYCTTHVTMTPSVTPIVTLTPSPTSTFDDIGGGPSGAPGPTPDYIYCLASVKSGDDPKNIRYLPSTESEAVATVSPSDIVYVVGQTTNNDALWYYVMFQEQLGWMSNVTITLAADCDPSEFQPPAPTQTPTSTPVPPLILHCIEYQTDAHGELIFTPKYLQQGGVDPDNKGFTDPRWINLLPPCGIVYHGLDIEPDTRFDTQFGIWNGVPLDAVHDAHFLRSVPPPIIPRRFNPLGNDNPTDAQRIEHEKNLIRDSSRRSCGFVTSSYSLNALGISNNVHPSTLMSTAALDINANGYPNGIALIKVKEGTTLYGLEGYGEQHFLNEIGNNVEGETNAFPIGSAASEERYSVEGIINYVRMTNTSVMVIVTSEERSGAQSYAIYDREYVTTGRDYHTKTDSGLLRVTDTKNQLVSHWVTVTGVSSDGKWFRVLNPWYNQIEYYNRNEFTFARGTGNKAMLIFTTQPGFQR